MKSSSRDSEADLLRLMLVLTNGLLDACPATFQSLLLYSSFVPPSPLDASLAALHDAYPALSANYAL